MTALLYAHLHSILKRPLRMHTGPFDRQVPTHLSVHNPNSKPVAYKVKVTAPKSYVVKPNSGRIEGETVNVQGEPWILKDSSGRERQQGTPYQSFCNP